MTRTFKFAARPVAAQRAAMSHWLTLCCWLYNNALEQRILWWRMARKGLSFYDQCKQLTELRNATDAGEWASLPALVARSALARVENGFKAFFRRLRAGEKKAGFPRFRPQHRYTSFGIGCATITLGKGNNAFVRIPCLGLLRFKMHRPIKGEILNIELSRDYKGRWFVHISCDLGPTPDKCNFSEGRAIGIDVGLTSYATLSNGEKIDNPRWFRRGQEKLARAQVVLSRKPKPGYRQKNSKSRIKARIAVARAHAHIANQRRDFQYKLAVELLRQYDLICFEALRIAQMVHGNLAKSILDAAWGQFIAIMICKAEEAGKHVITVDPRGTTQECSSCGATVSKCLKDQVHACSCGCVLNRDHNAAINILARGLRVVPEQFPLLGPELQTSV